MEENTYQLLPDETVAEFLDGRTMNENSLQIFDRIPRDAELCELLDVALAVDNDLGGVACYADILPMTAMAALSGGNMCNLQCEGYILRKRGIKVDDDEICRMACDRGWLTDEGTALHNIGRVLESFNVQVSRRYNCTVDDIRESLSAGRDVIAVVDGGELTDTAGGEIFEDMIVGETPDHAVAILDYGETGMTVYNPETGNEQDVYPQSVFADAWADSKNYLIIASDNDMETYVPHPIDLSDVELEEELMELREAIAENAHEVWAANRRREGWTYGPRRDDGLKQTPDMVPYSRLSDSERHYDREMAMNTIKLLKKLGYDLVKR